MSPIAKRHCLSHSDRTQIESAYTRTQQRLDRETLTLTRTPKSQDHKNSNGIREEEINGTHLGHSKSRQWLATDLRQEPHQRRPSRRAARENHHLGRSSTIAGIGEDEYREEGETNDVLEFLESESLYYMHGYYMTNVEYLIHVGIIFLEFYYQWS